MTKLEQDALCSQVLEIAAELYGATRVEAGELCGALVVYRNTEEIGRVSMYAIKDYTLRGVVRHSLECMAPGCMSLVGTNHPLCVGGEVAPGEFRYFMVCREHEGTDLPEIVQEAERRGIIPLRGDPYREAREREEAIERVERAELARLKAKYEGTR